MMKLERTCLERAIDDERPSTVVVTAVADATDNEPTEIEPLFGAIDPDGLDSLFQTNSAASERTGGYVGFTLEGYDVVVHGTRKVVVKPPSAAETTGRAGDTN